VGLSFFVVNGDHAVVPTKRDPTLGPSSKTRFCIKAEGDAVPSSDLERPKSVYKAGKSGQR
jgi:hypothetical protein